jgi:hypothetical protein
VSFTGGSRHTSGAQPVQNVSPIFRQVVRAKRRNVTQGTNRDAINQAIEVIFEFLGLIRKGGNLDDPTLDGFTAAVDTMVTFCDSEEIPIVVHPIDDFKEAVLHRVRGAMIESCG